MRKETMKKLFICLLIVPLFGVNGCRKEAQNAPRFQRNNVTRDFDFAPLEEQTDMEFPPEITPPTETDTPPDVWDVSDVDVSQIDPTKKLISFTFDDAPTRKLENLFAVFANFNEQNPDCTASATYFFNGNLFDNENFQLLHTALAMGFELGNHTFSHYDLSTLSEAEIQREIQKTDEILQRTDGKKYHLLRAPFGRVNDLVKNLSPTPLIDWSIDTVDWKGVTADEIYEQVMQNAFSGAIVLFHDGYTQTIEAVKRLLPDLKDNGYQIVSVSQLAKMHNCNLQRGKVYIRAKKQGK